MIKIICVGKKHETMHEQAITHYEKRLSAWQKVDWHILPPSGSEHSQAREEESKRIMGRLATDDYVVLLDEIGKNITSPELASIVERAQNASKNIVCIIGGAHGVDETLKARADTTIAFGLVVFPHQLIRVMLLEQLYRAYSINAGSNYHHL